MANKLQKKKITQKIVKKARPEAAVSARKEVKHTPQNFTLPQAEFVTAVGRRKTASARVQLYKAPGDFVVNNKLVSEYFQGIMNAPVLYNKSLVAADVLGKYAISVRVSGAGLPSQLDAVNHGIARALVKLNPDIRALLKPAGLLTRDDRMKETRKIGKGGKARRTKQSPKR